MFSPRRPPLAFTVEDDVACEVRDGTILRADVYRPTAPGRYPVLMSRTPYDKKHPMYTKDATALAAQGYIVVIQDVRGRYASQGSYDWIYGEPGQTTEANDGYDSVEWAADLPGAEGQVGTFGTSYPTWCSWRLAGARPPSLKAVYASGISPHMTVKNYGIFDLGRRMQWVHQVAADLRARAGAPFGPYDRHVADEIWRNVLRDKWVWRIPLDSIPEEVFGDMWPDFKQHFRDMTRDYWAFDKIWSDVDAAVCCMTSWWDRQAPTIDHFSGMRRFGPAATRSQHRVLVGPWSHNTYFMKRKLGARDYGPQAEGDFSDLLAYWFDARLKGIDNGLDSSPPVRVFVLNDNAWFDAEDWPVPGTEYLTMYLRSRGSANTVRGDGVLSLDAPGADETPDRYAYDPADPVMSLMGADTQHAPCDQSPLDGRRDVLVYQTEPLSEEMLLVGPVTMTLHAATDAPDTDFAVKLIEVGPDGMAINLSFGIVRARYRAGPGTDAPMVPGEAQAFSIELMPIGIRLRKGSRLRLDVASSDFPNFDRNHNTGADYWSDGELRVAQQTIFHDSSRPSHIVLPLAPSAAFKPVMWIGTG